MSPQLLHSLDGVKSFLRKHHPVLFISFIGILLAVSIWSLYVVLTSTAPDPNSTGSTIGSFDAKTVQKIKNLHDSSDTINDSLEFPTPRANPFIEKP